MQKTVIGLIILSISLTFTTIGFETAFAEEIKIDHKITKDDARGHQH